MSTKSINYLSDDYWEKLANQSLIRFFILKALKGKDLHGYLLIREIRELSRDFCSPSESTLYPALDKLLKAGLIARVNPASSEKKVYCLTPKGKEAFKIAAKTWNRIIPSLSRSTIL
jgi:DNA-binding PadR family transcriptional regulator